MPPFQTLQDIPAGQKRKADQIENQSGFYKRQSLGEGQSNCQRETDILPVGQVNQYGEQYWMVQWRAPQYKKHKTWDGDGVLAIRGHKGVLYDLEGKILTMGKTTLDAVSVGSAFTVGNKELEIDCAISRSDYFSGACFDRDSLDTTISEPKISHTSSSSLTKKFVPLKPMQLNPSRPAPSSRDIMENPEKQQRISLHPVDLIQIPQDCENVVAHGSETHWIANWRRPQHKKHKTWDGDAYVSQSETNLTLISEDGKLMGTSKWNGISLYSGYQFQLAGKTVELDSQIPVTQIPCITGSAPAEPIFDDVGEADDSILSAEPSTLISSKDKFNMDVNAESTRKSVAPMNFYGKPVDHSKGKGPLHNPDAEDAVVMKAPTKEHEKKFNPKNRPVIPVVIDPILARHLRPHQKDGVKFLYECVMGLRRHEGQGCILADEMGMGKTLQTITLVWTLLKQTPYAGGPPVCGKVLIACPVSLVNNWKKEFHKWLGKDRVGVFVGDKDKSLIKQFVNSKIHQVLVVGYEKLRTVIADLVYCMPPIGLIICDEGHRLKSSNNKTSTMFEALRTPRRIILSGTPIQNDLGEFHAMADFCNPGLLDDYNTFRRVYETPILKSRAPGCSDKEREIGEARAAQLLTVSKSFVLRRDANILNNYLPPKHEYVVFVTPTAIQKAMFAKILQADTLSSIIRDSTARSLALIGILTKMSNSPILLKAAVEKGTTKVAQDGLEAMNERVFDEALKLIPERAQPEDVSLSGKLAALANILKAIRKNTDEKCIIVSHYTSTLNIIEAFCKKKCYTYLRLDGQTPVAKRQEYVDSFNRSSQANRFLFLLSAKAGGVGLNLIGASRLCLIDSDWNPSHDLQAMARIHRDGQKRPVFIYRLLTAGTIDEKIYQRQVTKLGLSDSLMGTGAADGGGKSKSDSFSHKDLRDLFTIQCHTACHTHDLLQCPCNAQEGKIEIADPPLLENTDDTTDEDEDGRHHSGFMAASQVRPEKVLKASKASALKKKAELAALGEWTHINCLHLSAQSKIHDSILRNLIYVPTKSQLDMHPSMTTSRVDSLLDAVDLENIGKEAEPPLSVDEVPGGTMCFLFEKGSNSSL